MSLDLLIEQKETEIEYIYEQLRLDLFPDDYDFYQESLYFLELELVELLHKKWKQQTETYWEKN